ncbi:MAG: aldo/keto reductase [Gemmatimonadota bacterium]
MRLTRRQMLRTAASAGAAVLLGGRSAAERALGAVGRTYPAILQRPIPSSGELLPAVGIGTARRYDVGTSAAERASLREVLRAFPELGGKVIDTAPSYGAAEVVVGDLAQEIGNREKLFLATKVRADGRQAGIDQMQESLRRLHTDRIDLMQVHNLVDTETQLATMREWKEAGRIRYVGITTSSNRQHEAFENVMRSEELDFVQVNYSLANRQAEQRLLPLAADRGIAVLVNLPFGRGRLFRAVGDRPLPGWTAEFDCESWAQFFLKFLLSNEAVTCVIPGTAKMEYLADNVGAARGRLPDEGLRARMVDFFDAL